MVPSGPLCGSYGAAVGFTVSGNVGLWLINRPLFCKVIAFGMLDVIPMEGWVFCSWEPTSLFHSAAIANFLCRPGAAWKNMRRVDCDRGASLDSASDTARARGPMILLMHSLIVLACDAKTINHGVHDVRSRWSALSVLVASLATSKSSLVRDHSGEPQKLGSKDWKSQKSTVISNPKYNYRIVRPSRETLVSNPNTRSLIM